MASNKFLLRKFPLPADNQTELLETRRGSVYSKVESATVDLLSTTKTAVDKVLNRNGSLADDNRKKMA